MGYKGRDLVKLTGAKVSVVAKCSGIDGTWGYRSYNYGLSKKVSASLAVALKKQGERLVVGECHLANYSIYEETGAMPIHPVQLLAAAYGIGDGAEESGLPRTVDAKDGRG